MKEHIYYVKGMHCASCEVLIEKALLKFNNIKSVSVSLAKGTAQVEYEKELPNIGKLNRFFEKYKYTFYNNPPEPTIEKNTGISFVSLIIAISVAILLFIILPKTNLAGLVSINSSSSLPAIFLFGILAGLSSCAALVGGIVLSMSKQWSEMHSGESGFNKKFEPHVLFNAGRLASYTVLGGVLGLIGSALKINPNISSLLVIVVSAFMIILGLQMLGVKALEKFQISAPKNLTRYVADEKNFKGKYMPAILGALTFILPCGFTITAQGLALISGSVTRGAEIMLAFSLGTLPMLLAIGLSSLKFLSSKNMSTQFLKTAGIIVIVFALFNINSQLNVLGKFSLSNLNSAKGAQKQSDTNNSQTNDLPPVVGGFQIIKMQASSTGYSPNYIKVKANIPVKWEVKDVGTSGCTNAIVARQLFQSQIDLENGKRQSKNSQLPNRVSINFLAGWE